MSLMYPWANGLTLQLFKGARYSAERAAIDSGDWAKLDHLIYNRSLSIDGGIVFNDAMVPRQDERFVALYKGVIEVRWCGPNVLHKIASNLMLTCGTIELSTVAWRNETNCIMQDLFQFARLRAVVKFSFSEGRVNTDVFDLKLESGEWRFGVTRFELVSANQTAEQLATPIRMIVAEDTTAAVVEQLKVMCTDATAQYRQSHPDDVQSRAKLERNRALNPNGFTHCCSTFTCGRFYMNLVDEIYRNVKARWLENHDAIAWVELPLDRVAGLTRNEPCPWKKETVRVRVNDAEYAQYELRWHRTAFLRWPFNHPIILDAAIVLLDAPLPPYVLLEVLDWLPGMDRQNHVRKIRLIESVRASIRRVRGSASDCENQ